MRTEVIFGSPGCGKTFTLMEQLELELASGTPPNKIGFVSFTKVATEEAIARACAKFHFVRDDLPWFRTLHSMCFQYLGMRRADVLDHRKMQEFAKAAGIRLTSRKRASEREGYTSPATHGDRAMYIENLARVKGRVLREEYDDDVSYGGSDLKWDECRRIAADLQRFKRERNIYDFTDMMTMFVRATPRLGLQVLFGDEQQDQSKLGWTAFRQASTGCRRVVVAGDDDQAIYSPWAGADVNEFINIQGDARVLGQSHRVPRNVQAVAHAVIARVKHRRPKKWAPRDEAGEVSYVPYFHHADLEAPGDLLILARNSYVLNEQVEPELRARGIVFERNGKTSIDADVVTAAQDWEALRAGRAISPAQALAIARHIKSPPACPNVAENLEIFPEVTLTDMYQTWPSLKDGTWYEIFDAVPQEMIEYVRAARGRGEKLNKRPRVRISTIHSAKGAESDNVILMSEMAPRTYRDMERFPDDEARVFYVGVTRARERLTIVGSSSPNQYRFSV